MDNSSTNDMFYVIMELTKEEKQELIEMWKKRNKQIAEAKERR